GHGNGECEANATNQTSMEQVNFMRNPSRQQSNPYSNNYNPGWRNHPNFSWSNQGAQKNFAPNQAQQQSQVPLAPQSQVKPTPLE
ncbi:hypothetical protein PIB30_107644, partial [Stylosanthes scabra]|nr:hypothetical protein [Stylosanthes scabra]